MEDPVTVDYSPPVVFTGLTPGIRQSGRKFAVEEQLHDGGGYFDVFFSNEFWEKNKVRDGDLFV